MAGIAKRLLIVVGVIWFFGAVLCFIVVLKNEVHALTPEFIWAGSLIIALACWCVGFIVFSLIHLIKWIIYGD